jgi:hypothetical protein
VQVASAVEIVVQFARRSHRPPLEQLQGAHAAEGEKIRTSILSSCSVLFAVQKALFVKLHVPEGLPL